MSHSRASKHNTRRQITPRLAEPERSLEGLSGMVLGAVRRDNVSTQPDVYLEFAGLEPQKRKTRTEEEERRELAEEEEEEEQREPLDRGEPTEDKGLDR